MIDRIPETFKDDFNEKGAQKNDDKDTKTSRDVVHHHSLTYHVLTTGPVASLQIRSSITVATHADEKPLSDNPSMKFNGMASLANINLSSSHLDSKNDIIELLAPENFAVVEGGVYRSSFPRSKNIQFLKKLKLKSVVSLVPEDYPQVMLEFYHSQGTKLLAHGLEGNKWPFKGIDFARLQYTLHDILNPDNRPLLIHCNKGKHRTGSVIGCLRKIRNWAISAIFAEYLLYASPKTRLEDQMLIESFEYDPTFRLDEDSEKKLFKEMKKKAKLKKDDDDDEEDGSDTEDKKDKKKDKEKKKDKDRTKVKEQMERTTPIGISLDIN